MATYTPDQLLRRDRSVWTKVQAVLAPIQFVAFLVSFGLVVRYLTTGEDYTLTTASVLIKIGLLWIITLTGAVWEHEIYGHWFMAKEFFWEDFGNLVAMVFHNAYFLAVGLGWSPQAVMTLMLAAYVSYLVNMGQFLWRGIQAGRQRRAQRDAPPPLPVDRLAGSAR